MSLRDTLRPKSVALDAGLVAAIIVGANLLFDRAHPGWLNLNPSPYLLLPLLLGGRYGFGVGVLSGLAAVTLILLQQFLFATAPRPNLREALATAPFLYTGLLFTGGICGELFGWFRRDRAQAEAQLEKLGASVRRLDADVRYLRGVKDELDRVAAARDGEVSALDTGLRRLQAASAEDIPSEVLQFLKRQVRLADAAVYAVSTTGQPLRRLTHIGRDTHLPPTLLPASSALVRLALTRASLVTLPELLNHGDPPTTEPTLLAAPLRDVDGRARALLVVTGLPFINFNAQSANLIALICDWAGEALDLASESAGRYRVVAGSPPRRIFTRAHFQHLITLALQAHARHRLPSSVVLISLPGATSEEQSRFEIALLGVARTGDYAAELGLPHPHLAVLLPLVGERGASIFIERSRQFLRQHGPWSRPVSIRRVEFGRTADAATLLAELDSPEPTP